MTRHRHWIASLSILASLLLISGCEMMQKDQDEKGQRHAVAVIKPSAAATTQPTNNDVTGTVTFTEQGDDTVKVVADLKGFASNSTHGFHIHEKGDLSAPDLSSAGGHYNPTGMHHGGPPEEGQTGSEQRHAGDLGNITADADGNVHLQMVLPGCSLHGDHSLLGRSVIVHAKPDDLKSDPSGNSGARIAGGVIEMKK